jgi:hypothetical protein
MKESNLRLRLVVRRHDLPEVRLLFSINLQDEPTIAALLEQVNDTVPLESPDWGLDDYVVEIEDSHGHAFECLHFQAVATILDRDEEVIVRPLFTVDRKKRLLSGRHQISTDGKHLVDGVPFGKPRLRAPRGRPPIDIPPLKKRRITFDHEEEDAQGEEEDDDESYREGGSDAEDQEDAPLMLMENGEEGDEPSVVRIQAAFDDADNRDEEGEQAADYELEEGEEEEEEEDLEGEEIDEEELLDELRDLQRENDDLGEEAPSLHQQPATGQRTPAESEPDVDLARLNKITALRRAFPAVDCHVYEDVLRRNALNERMAFRELSKSYEASMTLDQMGDLLASFSCPVLPSSNNFDAGAEEQGAESDAESTSSLVKRFDRRGFPSGSILDGSASRAAAEALRLAGHAVKAPVHTRFDDDNADENVGNDGDSSSSDSSSSDSEDDDEDFNEDNESESDGSSNSDSDGSSSESDKSDDSDSADEDSGPELAPTKPVARSDLSGRSGLSGGASEPANESSQSKKRKRGPAVDNTAETASVQDSSSSDDSSDSSSESESEDSSSDSSDEDSEREATSTTTVASSKVALPKPATAVTQETQPDTATKRSPPGQGLSKTKARNARRKLALKAKKAALTSTATPSMDGGETGAASSQPSKTKDAEFQQRKQALLDQLATQNSQPMPPTPTGALASSQRDAAKAVGILPAAAQREDADASPSTLEAMSQQRSKLDVGAGRRMLFASLGLRNPKTKADEEKIRGDLMKGIRPLANHRIEEPSAAESGFSTEPNQLPEEAEDEDPEAWRSKITYSAVECVQEGVELSEPPFPFVQRWDPQQQNSWRNKRGGRGKRKDRNQGSFYEDDGALPNAKKQRVNDAEQDTSFATDAHDYTQDVEPELNYDDIPESGSSGATAEQPSQFADMDDLPSIPEELSALPTLELSEAKPGMVITWKQMIVSKATNWAPNILDLTAVIVSIDEVSEELRVVLARRDRHLDGKEKVFDEEGNRVYDRFDAPDDDDDAAEGEDHEGYRTVQFSDMMDPRIVQQPLRSLQRATLDDIVESQDQADTVMADHEGLADGGLGEKTFDHAGEDGLVSSEHREPERDGIEAHPPSRTDGHDDLLNEHSYGSVIPDSVPHHMLEAPITSLSSKNLSSLAEDISITDDTRHEISVMINEAGFRADVSPTVAKATRFSIEDLSSPSRQLDEEMSEAAVVASHQGSRSPAPAAQSSRAPSTLRELALPLDTAVDGQAAASADNEQTTPKANALQSSVIVAPLQSSQLPVPASSASSVRSGRQPANEYSVDWSDDDLLHRSEELGEDHAALDHSRMDTTMMDDISTPTRPVSTMKSVVDESDNPFTSSPLPSLEEMFSSAPFRATQSPVRLNHSLVGKAAAHVDEEYEDAIRRIEGSEGQEDDQDQIRGPSPSPVTWDESRGQIKEERWSRAAIVQKGKAPASFFKAVSPPPKLVTQETSSELPKRRRTTATGNQKEDGIPEGSQVVSLLTSSPEPEVEEHYLDDSKDSTYAGHGNDSDASPVGKGWLRKALPGRAVVKGSKAKVDGGRGKRGVSLSALPAAKKAREAVNGKGIRGRRKTSVKF